MARLRDAAAALSTVRNGWDQYVQAIEVVRNLVADSPALREQVEEYQTEAGETNLAQD